MLRFFSKRHKPRRDQKAGAWERHENNYGRGDNSRPDNGYGGGARRKKPKNRLPCRVILLDGADLSIDIEVREKKRMIQMCKQCAGG